MISLNDKPAYPPFMVAFIQVQCVFGVMKSVVAGHNLRAVALQGTFYIEKRLGGIGVVASSEWSPIKSGRMGRFGCIWPSIE